MSTQSQGTTDNRLVHFIGDWQDAGRTLPGPFGPGGPTSGRTTYRWQVGGRWLIYTSHMDIPGMGEYVVHGGVTFNDQTKKYDAFAANSLGNLLVYEGLWTDPTTLVFTLIHPPPAARSRVVYRILSDDSMHLRSERLAEDGAFQAYFETEMTRL
jgi:hypothetical protein